MTLFLSEHGTFFLSFIAAVGNSGHLSNCHCSGIIFFLMVWDLLRHATILIHVSRCEFPFISPSRDCWGLLALRIRVFQQTVLENSLIFPLSVFFLFKQVFYSLCLSLCVSLSLYPLCICICCAYASVCKYVGTHLWQACERPRLTSVVFNPSHLLRPGKNSQLNPMLTRYMSLI